MMETNTSRSSSSSGPKTTAGGGGAQRPTLTSTGAVRSRPATSRASPAPAPAPVPSSLPEPPPPPSYRRGKWLEAEHEEVWRLGHTYILASALSQSPSPPSPPSSSIATPSPPPSSSGAGAGSVQDWENLRLHPEGLMKTQARLRSASALRTMFLKMKKESSSLLEQQQQQPASTRGGGSDAHADDLASPSASSSSVPSTFRVRFKSEVFEPSSSSRTVRAGGVTTTAQSSSATASAAEEEEEPTKDCWTPAEDAVLLAAMITLPNTAAVVASSFSAAAPSSSPTSTSLAHEGGSGSGNEGEAQQQVAKGSKSLEGEEGNGDEIEEASTPLARAAAWPPTTTTSTSTTTTATRDPRPQSRIAGRSAATVTTATGTGLTTSAGWLKVREIAERTYQIMEAGSVQEEEEGGGGGGAKRTRRLRRDVKELENRWRTKWRVDGITKNLAAPELLLPAIRQQTDFLSKLSVEVLTELDSSSSSSSSRQPGGGGTAAAAAAAAVDSSPGSGLPKLAPSAVQQQQEEQPEPSAPITGNADAETKRSQEDDDPRAAYPTPALGTDALLPRKEDVEYGRDDPVLQGIDEMDELQRSGTTTTTTRTPDLLEPAPPRPETSVPDDAQVQDHRHLSTPAAPQAAATADVNKMIGLGLDFGYGVGTGIGGHLQQPHSQPPPPLYSTIPTATLTGTEELDPDQVGVRFTTTTIPLRRASSSAVLSSPSPSTSPAAVLIPSQKSILSTKRATTSFAPFTQVYERPPSSSVDALRRAHQAQSQPQSQPQPAPFQMYFQPKPRPLMPFSVGSPPQQQWQRFPQQPQQKQQPVSPVHSLQSASMSYKPFSRFSTTTTATTDPPPSSNHRDMLVHGTLASSASSSSRGHSFLGTVQEEGISQPPQNLEQPLFQPSQVRPLLPTISSGDDPDRHYDRGTKRRWSEADLYAHSPIYTYETSLGPPPHPQQVTTSSWPWTFATETAGGPMDQQRQQQPNALDRAIAAGRPLTDYSPVFDQAGGENDCDQDGRDPRARTHQHAERDKKG